MPIAPDGPLAQGEGRYPDYTSQTVNDPDKSPLKPGLLHPVGDPVGRGLHTTLKPTVGAVTSKIGEPPGEAAERVQNTVRNAHKWEGDKKNVKDKDLPGGERIGGNAQTAKNPLGL